MSSSVGPKPMNESGMSDYARLRKSIWSDGYEWQYVHI